MHIFFAEGVPDSDLIVLLVRFGSWLFSRSARNSSYFLWRTSSDSLRVTAQASRYSAWLSVIVRRRAFRFLIASRSSGVDQGLVYRPALDFPTWSFAAARRAELKRWTLSRTDTGLARITLSLLRWRRRMSSSRYWLCSNGLGNKSLRPPALRTWWWS